MPPVDITKILKHLQFIELDAAQLPHALSDMSIAAVNTNCAISAGLPPSRNTLVTEGPYSTYTNKVTLI